MSPRTYSLRALFAFVTFFAICCGVTIVLLPHAQSRSYLAAFTLHVLAILNISLFLALYFGNLGRALAIGFINLVLMEVAWLVFHRGLGANITPDSIFLNPLLALALFTCPVACATNRYRAAIIAFVLAVIATLVVAFMSLRSLAMSGTRGTGLAGMIVILASIAAILMAAAATYFTAMICDLAELRRESKSFPSDVSAKHPPQS
jgi:hypothetical protein